MGTLTTMNEKLAIAETPNQSPSITLDDIDRKIVALCQLDGRRSYASIGRELGISEGTVRTRINQLTSANILRFIAVVDPVEIGYKSWAMLGITVVPGISPYDLALELSEHSEVTYATVVASKFDLLVEIWCLNSDKLADFLEAHCYQSGKISSVETMVGLRLYKWLYPVPGVHAS